MLNGCRNQAGLIMDCFSALQIASRASLKKIVALLEDERVGEAIDLSDRLTQVVNQVFALVRDMTDGNAFSNANKAIDHYMAFGTDARLILPPRLHAGTLIPKGVVLRVGEVLESADLIPDIGYLNL